MLSGTCLLERRPDTTLQEQAATHCTCSCQKITACNCAHSSAASSSQRMDTVLRVMTAWQPTAEAALAMLLLTADPALATPYGASLAFRQASTDDDSPPIMSLLIWCSKQLLGACWGPPAWNRRRTWAAQDPSVLSTVHLSTASEFHAKCS